MSITTTPEQTVSPPAPEDIERLQMLPLDETTGRRAVLLGDISLGHSVAREAANTNAQRRKTNDPENNSIFIADSRYHRPDERDALREWEDAMQASSLESFVLSPKEALKEELSQVRQKLSEIDVAVFGAEIDQQLDAVAPRFLVDQLESDFVHDAQWNRYARSAEVVKGLRTRRDDEDDLEILIRRPIKMPRSLDKSIQDMFTQPIELSKIPKGKWLRWLTRTSDNPIEQEEYDAQLLNFLQWHNNRLETLQKNPEFKDAIEYEAAEYMEDVRKAETEGWLSPGAYDRVKLVMQVDVAQHFIGDEFYAAILGGANAYAYRDDRRTAYNPRGARGDLIARPIAAVKRSAKHEFNHLMGWLPERWLDEAVTEHIALCFKGKDVGDVDAYEDGGSYPDERNLLAALIYKARAIQEERGEGEYISVADFTRVYSTENSKRGQEIADLFRRLEDIYGFRIMPALRGFISQEERKFEQAGVGLRKRQARVAELARHMIYQQPEQLKDYL